jgi:5-methyltetrahydrofolate--homocysteine methyltransferase
MMLEGAGFQVINLGINNDAQKFVDAVVKYKSDLVGLSALLTTTMPYMQVIIKALKEAGLRDKVGVMIGGAPVTQAFADEIGADAYCRDAAIAVETAKRLVAAKRD